MSRFIIFLASFGFIGYIPFASGTFGTFAAIPFAWLFARCTGDSVAFSLIALTFLIAGACWLAGQAEELLSEHDSHKIVIDEVVGFLTTMLFLPFTWQSVLIGFLVFRVFDVVKPFPAGAIDAKVPGGPGVVLDDVVSGVYANLVTRVVLFVLT